VINSQTDNSSNTLIDGIFSGNKRAVARAISKIENESSESITLLDHIYKHTGRAHRIGITGPPGAGKSTFTNQLIKTYRAAGRTVGIIAVDPSSPFTGGAILGDRIRMSHAWSDPGVFIRSMATRGSLGGLARQTTEAADVLDTAGYDIIIYETVGVGQIEQDIMSAADTILVMSVPDAGDVIQGMKAGLMEIGDLFVVNKADLEGAERMKADLEFVLHLREKKIEWEHPVLLAESRAGEGIKEIYDGINRHLAFLKNNGRWKEKQHMRAEERIKHIVNEHLLDDFWDEDRLKILGESLSNEHNQISPYSIARKLLEKK